MDHSNILSDSELEGRLTRLRAELKQWERDFAASSNGRKAGREDIKQHPNIALKYKAYDKLRQTRSQPSNVHQKSKSVALSRKRLNPSLESTTQNPPIQTPSKRAKHAHPLHSHPVNAFASRPLHPALLDPYDPPASTFLSPSRARTSLGPTPQKDGKVLGIFDVLSSGSTVRTPTKRKTLDAIAGNGQQAATPSKHVAGGTQKLPNGASKGQGLSTVFTPASHRVAKAKADSTPVSGSGVRKLKFDDTPVFLRRDSQRAAAPLASLGAGDGDVPDGEAVAWSPVVPRRASKLHRPVAGRGLSALVQGLRKMEDARLDEDLEMMREMEGESTFESFASKMNHQAKKPQPPKILVGDSQVPDMPLGPDGAVESEEETGGIEGKTRDGQPLKVWRKKGQKRTTRAVKMRPSAAKWKPEPVWNGGVELEEDEEASQAAVEETPSAGQKVGGASGCEDAEPEWNEEADDECAADPNAEAGTNDMKTQIADWKKQKKDIKQAKEDGKREGIIQKVKKKVSATAHANFRALKIRNKNSKAKSGSKRFRRSS